MIEDLFLHYFNVGFTSFWMMLDVFILGLMDKYVPKKMVCWLWIFTGLRLILPVTPVSAFSLVPTAKLPFVSYLASQTAPSPSVLPDISEAAVLPSGQETGYAGVNFPIVSVLTGIWITIALLFMLTALIQYGKLKRKIGTATRLMCCTENIYQSEFVSSPFVMGIRHPRIYLPYRGNEEDLPYILAHEKKHIQRNDHLFKICGFFVLSVHWFNPLVWLWFALFNKDMEMACDEQVIQSFTFAERQNYSIALLNCGEKYRGSFACMPGFGGSNCKKRVTAIMNYQPFSRRQRISSVVLCIFTLLFFMTDLMDVQGNFRAGEKNTEIQGIEQYKRPENFPGYSKLDIFPWELSGNVGDGEYIYQVKDTLFDPTVQMFLQCTYTKEAYEKEKERISNIQEEYQGQVKRAVYDEEKFLFPAYITVYANNYCYEYALFPGNQTIIYVFLQFAQEEELDFDQRFLPLNYHGHGEYDRENGDSIYVFYQDNEIGVSLY